MIDRIEARHLVMHDGTRIPLPDGVACARGPDQSVWLTGTTKSGARVRVELTRGANEAYVLFALDHLTKQITGAAP